MNSKLAFIVAGVHLVAASGAWGQQPASGFDHPKHARVFPVCVTCHEGAAQAGRPVWPEPASCATCHDGTIQSRVAWQPRTTPPRTNLRFEHLPHAAALARARGDSVAANTSCTGCHSDVNTSPMAVRLAATERCLTCHEVRTAHFAAPDAACSTCHLPLARATRLTRADVSRFPEPPSHREPGFAGKAHGAAARAGTVSCATCHARDFCQSCHVDAPEQATIQSLAEDPRSLGIRARLEAPGSHRAANFLQVHGRTARAAPRECATCHARESCLACHQAATRLAAAMPVAGLGRAPGVIIARREPVSHATGFRDRHSAQAAAMPATCSGCHARNQCVECHRPTATRAGGYHPAGFLERHPSAAYNRETSCSDCHNPASFCATCHARAGTVTARLPIGAGFHDAKSFFLFGHGVAARQSLETCVSCHRERDCVSCHSALGRRFNPHGPDFNPPRLIRKNPEVCMACHGAAIPGAP